jgi:putative CocE/NonD family hydrolase
MTLISEVLSRRMGLPRAQTSDVVRERDLGVEMDDGAVLLADRWVAKDARERPQPTVLVRSCYGRGHVFGLVHGRLLAERGLQVVIQSVRGTFGSEGRFNPFDERADGLATVRWLRRQPWHEGPVGMTGSSYLGLVQWAIAADAGDELGALSIHGSASQFHGQSYPGGSMSLETSAQWLALIALQERGLTQSSVTDKFRGLRLLETSAQWVLALSLPQLPAPFPLPRALRRLHSLLSEPSLEDLDRRVTGEEVAWFRDALSNPDREGDFWVTRDYSDGVGKVNVPIQMITGWYDSFTPWQLEDYAALEEADRPRQLIIGPWTHTQEDLTAAGAREGLAWLRAYLLGDPRLIDPAPVHLFITGEHAGWRTFDRWPPPESAERRLWIADGGRLAWEPPTAEMGGGCRYRYDPNDPTPSVGGPVMMISKPVIDNRALEARADVVTFTTPPLAEPLEAIGPVRVELWARGSEPYFDLFARVCDVDRKCASWNVCDALASVAPGRFEQADRAWRVEFELWPMGHRFAAGNRIRLQVSSGAHPRYVRNPGTGEDPLAPPELRAVDVELLHGPACPSSVTLSVFSRG